jgi:NADP-dependent 3-hydroxy acid dehydrogenase YdfG
MILRVQPLAGQTIAITGASAGIGAASARACAAHGMSVVLAARRAERLEALATELQAAGRVAIPVVADVTSERDMARMVELAVAETGRLDAVLCNAGIGFHGFLADTNADVMRRLMDVNFMGSFLAARAALPVLLAQGHGHLIFVSSIAGKRGLPRGSAYSATKFAQAGFAEALRAELAGSGVHVSTVYPISTETELREVMAREHGQRVGGLGPRQSAAHVASTIVRCLERPVPEVYPHRLSRVLALANVAAPSLADRVIRRFARRRRP